MTVSPYDKTVLRAALAVQADIAQAQQRPWQTGLPQRPWCELEQLVRRLGRANSQGWHAARRRLVAQALTKGERLQWQLGEILAELRRQASPRQPATAAEIYRDIVALREEFENVEIDVAKHALGVTTEPIELEGVYLGAFQIRLNGKDLARHLQPYRIVAMDPHPAAPNRDVTHPHVQDEMLCEGDGKGAIRAALAEGRLFDFFLLVAQILRSYGHGRAYVELKRWRGVTCHDCGASVNEEESQDCERCEQTLCESCCLSCPRCGRRCCSECTATCESCQWQYCEACLADCSECGVRTCRNCLNDDLCEDCHEKREEQRQQAEQSADEFEPGSGDAVESLSEPGPARQTAACRRAAQG